MTTRISALLVGDVTNPPWHPLEPVREQLEAILGDAFAIEATEDYDRMAALDKAVHPLFISYTDCWDKSLTPEQTAGVLRYVAGGGGLLVIHSGISLQQSYELLQVVGGKFTEHPPYQTLNYCRVGDHPLLDGVDDFTVDEEPYMYEFDPYTPRNVFLEYEFEGRRIPAGWEHRFGLGKVVYLQPGHHAPSFDPPAYRRLVQNAARWCVQD